jgi:hypothetical protein
VGDEEARQGIVVGEEWLEGYSSRLPVAAIADFAMAMMFQRRDPKRLDKRVHELS